MSTRLVAIAANILQQGRVVSTRLLPETPRAITLSSGWKNFDTAPNYPAATVRKDPFGKITVRGAVAQTTPAALTTGQVFATLPVGYRPNTIRTFIVASVNGSSVISVGAVTVTPNGEIMAYTPNLHGVFISLEFSFFE